MLGSVPDKPLVTAPLNCPDQPDSPPPPPRPHSILISLTHPTNHQSTSTITIARNDRWYSKEMLSSLCWDVSGSKEGRHSVCMIQTHLFDPPRCPQISFGNVASAHIGHFSSNPSGVWRPQIMQKHELHIQKGQRPILKEVWPDNSGRVQFAGQTPRRADKKCGSSEMTTQHQQPRLEFRGHKY